MADTENTRAPAGGSEDAEHAAWLADKIVALGDYAKEAAEMLRRWPAPASAPLEALLAVVGRYMCEDIARGMTGTSLHADASSALAFAREYRATPPSEPQADRDHSIFAAGWRTAANWMERDDLIADIGSPAYLKDMAAALSSGEVDGSDTRAAYDGKLAALPPEMQEAPQRDPVREQAQLDALAAVMREIELNNRGKAE